MAELIEVAPKVTADGLLDMLAAKYSEPHYILLRQVRDATGFDAGRTADAIGLGLYRSRGLDLVGFEVKVSRSDLVRELAIPDKAEAFAQFCDYWYLVLASHELAEGLDIPAHWGIYAPKGKRMHLYKKAEKMQCVPPPRYFTATLFKSVADHYRDAPDRARKEGYDNGWREGMKHGEENEEGFRKKAESLSKAISDFEVASGIRISEWGDNKQLGNIVRGVKEGDRTVVALISRLERVQEMAKDVHEDALDRLIKLREETALNLTAE